VQVHGHLLDGGIQHAKKGDGLHEFDPDSLGWRRYKWDAWKIITSEKAVMPPRRIEPGPGQESVWDYPRPPRVEPTSAHVQVVLNGVIVVDTRRAIRVLETSHPPAYYLPPEDARMEHFIRAPHSSYCEWKGRAGYYHIRVGEAEVRNAAWFYPEPARGFEAIRNYLAVYPQLMDACYVDGEKVRPQAGGFYGGWITNNVVGPFKGEPGTDGW
jgi:uncharacterized protein (DUF427 family)